MEAGLQRIQGAVNGSDKISSDNLLKQVDEEDEITSPALSLAVEKPTSTPWTNEMHGLYLNFMEASFVNQLHGHSSVYRSHHSRNHISSGMVLQENCWEVLEFESRKPAFRFAHKLQVTKSMHQRKGELGVKLAVHSGRWKHHGSCSHFIGRTSVSIDREVSDQDFANDEGPLQRTESMTDVNQR